MAPHLPQLPDLSLIQKLVAKRYEDSGRRAQPVARALGVDVDVLFRVIAGARVHRGTHTQLAVALGLLSTAPSPADSGGPSFGDRS